MVPVFLGATLLIYGMVFLLPGDPLAAIAGDRPLTPAVAAQLRVRYHLDDPFLLQYLHYLGGVLHGDLGGNAASGPVAVSQSLDTPLRLPHFGGEEGRLRRLALSAAINRPQICQQIFNGTRSPARDFTARSLPGFDPNIPGNDALDFNPEREIGRAHV